MPTKGRKRFHFKGITGEQGELFPSSDYDVRLPRLDPYAGHPGLTAKQQKAVETKHGVTVKSSREHYGRVLDKAFADADPGPQSHAVTLQGEEEIPPKVRPSARATRERFARGIRPEGYDWYDKERVKHHNLAQETGFSREKISRARAAVAQDIKESKELPTVRELAEQVKSGVSPDKVTGSGYPRNVKLGAKMLTGEATEKDLPGHKPGGFYQSFEYDAPKWGRPAMDRHMLRAGAPHLSDDEISDIQRHQGHTKSQGVVSPVHRVMEEGLRQAAESRGMVAQRAQPVVWFPSLQKSQEKAAAKRSAKREESKKVISQSQFGFS